MKECFKCNRVLPLSEFYTHPRMEDGHLNKCKTCTRRDVRDRRKVNRQHYLDYDRERSKDPERQAAITASTNKDPLKVWARKATISAITRGVLERLPCEVCGVEPADAHHEDYTQPLKVRWLCRRHHMETHHPLEESA
jgi:hypothetical protein